MPNKYWVFHYDQKFKLVNKIITPINKDIPQGELLGVFETYEEAVKCINEKAFYPNVIIEDRLSGQIYEQYCLVCQECGKEEYFTNEDVEFTKKEIEKAGYTFK